MTRSLLVATAAFCAALAGAGCAEAGAPATSSAKVHCKPPPPTRPITPAQGPLTIAIDGGYGDWGPCETRHRAALGAAVTRHEWDPRAGLRAQDALVGKAATRTHTRIHALLGGNDLGDPDSYRKFVVAFIRRYGVGGSYWAEHPGLDAHRYAIRTFELGNEPYFGEMSAEEYADAILPALRRVKRLRLPARIVLASRVEGTDASWMETLYRRIPRLNSLYYAFADHPYWYGHSPAAGGGEAPFERVETLRRRMDALGAADKPIFITEYGESTADCGEECVSEATQARHLSQMIAFCRRPELGIALLSIYQLIDRGTRSGDRELEFGLLRQNGSRKPSWAVVRKALSRS